MDHASCILLRSTTRLESCLQEQHENVYDTNIRCPEQKLEANR